MTYKEIAYKEKVSNNAVVVSVKKSILKMQETNKCISKENRVLISNLSAVLGLSFNDTFKIVKKYPQLLSLKIETLNKKKKTYIQLLNISQEDFLEIIKKSPSLLSQNPVTINNNVENSAKLLGISGELYIKLAVKNPVLLYQMPETLNKRIETAARLMKISKEDFIQMAVKRPVLFYQKPETLKERVEIMDYYKKIQNKKIKNAPIIKLVSKDKLYENILVYLLKKNCYPNLTLKYIKANLSGLLRTLENSIEIEIPKADIVSDFIRYSQNYSVKTVGKNLFRFIIKDE